MQTNHILATIPRNNSYDIYVYTFHLHLSGEEQIETARKARSTQGQITKCPNKVNKSRNIQLT